MVRHVNDDGILLQSALSQSLNQTFYLIVNQTQHSVVIGTGAENPFLNRFPQHLLPHIPDPWIAIPFLPQILCRTVERRKLLGREHVKIRFGHLIRVMRLRE